MVLPVVHITDVHTQIVTGEADDNAQIVTGGTYVYTQIVTGHSDNTKHLR